MRQLHASVTVWAYLLLLFLSVHYFLICWYLLEYSAALVYGRAVRRGCAYADAVCTSRAPDVHSGLRSGDSGKKPSRDRETT